MKTALALALLAATALAAPSAAAQDFGRPLAIGPYDDVPIPPRPVPGYGAGAAETVITTTTRRVVTAPAYGAYGAPRTVVTTRRVIAPAPLVEEPDVAVTGSFRPAVYPFPPRRVLKSGPDFEPEPVVAAPLVRERVVIRRVAPEPVVIEERVVTTRRILRPAPVDWDE
jgi:hypothetical protein